MFWNPICINKYKLDEIDQKESSLNESSEDELYDPSLTDNNNNLPLHCTSSMDFNPFLSHLSLTIIFRVEECRYNYPYFTEEKDELPKS